jgi:prepilin-type N-terminal cleavage/methylation domain-containing protein
VDGAAVTADRASIARVSATRKAGFTLLEVLVALAISGLCLMMLSGVVGRLAATRRAVYNRATVLDQGDAVVRMLRNLLRSVDVETNDARGPNLGGSGEELTVRSQGPTVLDLETGTTFRLHLVPSRDPASGALALAWTNPTTGTSFDETIAPGVAALRLAYRGRRREDGWASGWGRPVAELALVKVEITFSGPRGATTSAILAVNTKLPQACVADPLLNRCPQW